MQSTSVRSVADTQMKHTLGICCCVTNDIQNRAACNNNHFLLPHEFMGLECEQYSDGGFFWCTCHFPGPLDSTQFTAGLVWKGRDGFTYLCSTSALMAERLHSAGPSSFLHIFSGSPQDLSGG